MLSRWIDKIIARRHPPKPIQEIEAEVDERYDRIGHAIAQRFTRGNVNIKRGEFLTKRDIEGLRKPRYS